MWHLLDGIADAVDMVRHPRFYVPLFTGIIVAFVLWDRMQKSDLRDVLQVGAVLSGLVIGIVWDWGR
jgi:hypothetical protein